MEISVNLKGLSFDQAAAFLAHSFPNGGGEEAACIACIDGPPDFVHDIQDELGVPVDHSQRLEEVIAGLLANRVTAIKAEVDMAATKEDREAIINRYLYPFNPTPTG